MPFYTFRCTKCNTEFTKRFSFDCSQGDGVNCPECGASEISRVIEKAPVVIIKKGNSGSSGCRTSLGGICDLCNK
jgi:putative FmdB family regulatory protein